MEPHANCPGSPEEEALAFLELLDASSIENSSSKARTGGGPALRTR